MQIPTKWSHVAVCRFAQLVAEHGSSSHSDAADNSSLPKPPRTPRLFLEPKRASYQQAPLAQLWGLVEQHKLEEQVAVWVMDADHYDILHAATGGRARVIWGYMDQEFVDQVSTVPFPAPFPPDVQVRSCMQAAGAAVATPLAAAAAAAPEGRPVKVPAHSRQKHFLCMPAAIASAAATGEAAVRGLSVRLCGGACAVALRL